MASNAYGLDDVAGAVTYPAHAIAGRRGGGGGPVYVIPNASIDPIPVDLPSIPARMKNGKWSCLLSPTGTAWGGANAFLFHADNGDGGDSLDYIYITNPDNDTTYMRVYGFYAGSSHKVNTLYKAQTRAQFAAMSPTVFTFDMATGLISSPGWTLEDAQNAWTWNYTNELGVGHRYGYNDSSIAAIATISEVIEA